MGKYKKLLSNTAIFGIGTFASKVLVLLLMPFYTSILSKAEFGTADLITQTANLLIPLAAIGICDGIFRFALESRLDKRRVLSTGLAILLIGSAVMCGAVQFVRFFDALDNYILLITLYVIAANLHLAFANYIRAQGRNVLFAIQGILNTALTILLNILFLVAFDMGSTGYVLSVVVADIVMSLFLLFAARLYKDISVKAIDKKIAGDMLKFSIPYIPTTIMWLITSVSDRYIVTAYRSVEENGLYAAAYKLPTMLSLVSGVFIEAWHFSAVRDSDDDEKAEFFSTVYDNFIACIFFCASGIIAFSQIFTKILLADSYFDSWRYVPILVIATTFSTFVSFLGSVYFLKKKSALSMLTAAVGAVANIVLNFILIPKYGAMGAAVATFICYLLVYAIRAMDTRRYLKFDLYLVRTAVTTLLLFVQLYAWFAPFKYIWTLQIIVPVLIFALNGRKILNSVGKITKRFKKSKKV